MECVFMESIGRTALETRFLSRTLLENCGLSKVRLLRELRLLDLAASGGLARVGAEGSISSGSKYFSSQKWSQGFHDHPEKLDGVLYFARHDPTRKAYALFDRCEDAIAVLGPCLSWASQPELLGRILDLYKLGTDL